MATIGVNTRFFIKNTLEGIGKFTFETLFRITTQHPEHHFIFFFDRPYDQSFIFSNNITPVVLFPQARHPVLFYWWFEWSIAKALKKHKVDAFLSTDGFMTLNTKVPTLLVVHDIAHKHFPEYISKTNALYYDYFIPKFIKKAARIATVSTYSKQDIINHYGTSSDKIEVVYNGCDDSFKPLSADEKTMIKAKYTKGKDYFVYVGSVHPRKNVARLIQAFSHFKSKTQNTVKLLIVGRMAWKTGEVKAAFDQSEYQSDIIFTGYVEDGALPKITAAAIAMTYVSIFEGFGIPLLEAMYCDVPVITSNISSMPEVVGDAGIVVDPYDVVAIAEAMTKIYEEDTFRLSLIQKAKIQRTMFSWDKTADKLWQSLEQIMK